MRKALAGLLPVLLMLLTACEGLPARGDGVSEAAPLPVELLTPRPVYDASRPFPEMVKPHFSAVKPTRDWRVTSPPASLPGVRPDLIVEREGKVKVRLTASGEQYYLDLLALESEVLGEHPAHKIFRLQAMGVPVERSLARRLGENPLPQDLFQTIQFEYLPGNETAGVIAEVFPDGTFLVIPFGLPEEWLGDPPGQPGLAVPSHLHVNARALIANTSATAKEFEAEILALPFDEQRYPLPALARKDCQVYRESLQHETYLNLLAEVGYHFTPEQVVQASPGGPLPLGEELIRILRRGAGAGVEYFGFEGEWVTDGLLERRLPWIGECDIAGGVRRYRAPGKDQDDFYITVRRSLEPDKKQRYKIMKLDNDGSAQEMYTAPGVMLMALPLPSDHSRWLISSEGWPGPADGVPADPRWQSVYLVNIGNPEEYTEVQYPLGAFPKAPAEGLYGASASLSADGRYLFNTLYGFKDEGGGIWVVDLSRDNFAADPAAYARIVEWDHALSWTVLERQGQGAGVRLGVFLTGKEVADDFAMTANLMRLRSAGLESKVEYRERLLRMVGWNPVPFGWQKTGEHQFLVAVETYFNYESSLLPRALGVYLVPVDTGLGQ
ncbi:MAG: hypothetical protein EXR54_00415 [Dehalococcoidia bacterium]|nr:hypothetical protein [Dehalococcoidia bacterium]MSQ16024.1 hypothetical protein [Dehalococcoidia bacterium]